MKQIKENTLAVSFLCPTDIDIGDPVVLSDDMTVAAIGGLAEVNLLGNVIAHEDGAASCVVSTSYRERRDDRESDGGPPVGHFVYDAAGKVVERTANELMVVAGTVEETYDISTGSNDAIKIKIEGGSSQTFTLDDDETTTAAEVATKINATATDFTADGSSGYVVLTVDVFGEDLEIEAVANDAYTDLGFTVGVYDADENYDASVIAGMVIKKPAPCSIVTANHHPFVITVDVDDEFVIKLGAGASQPVTLTAGTARTATQIAADLNGTLVGITASPMPGGYVKIAADNPYLDLEIEAVATDCYTILGLTVGVTSASTVVDTLEY